jgi:hypothetical protein
MESRNEPSSHSPQTKRPTCGSPKNATGHKTKHRSGRRAESADNTALSGQTRESTARPKDG